MTLNAVLKEARDLFFFFLASLVQAYFMCPRCNTLVSYGMVVLFTFILWTVLWKGNNAVTLYVSKKIPWMHRPLRRMVVGIISTVAYTLASVIVLLEIFHRVFHFSFGSGYYYTVYFSIGITIVISLVMHSRAFFLHWRQAAGDAERYEKESAVARYESLKNQVNPHFLFNTLNALTNLVHEDPDKAVKFIKQLSEVYRHVLATHDREVITLAEERKFLDAYLYLQQIRFGQKLKLSIQLDGVDSLVPPLVLQMLVENAIKHNVVSEEDPLEIRAYVRDGYIVVENDVNRKDVLPDESAGIGLDNIVKRYSFLTDRAVEVIHHPRFIVRLPVIPTL